MSLENRELCITYFRKCEKSKKIIPGFPEVLTILRSEITPNGLTNDELKLLTSIITKVYANSMQRSSLIKCLIPVGNVSDEIVESVGIWFISTSKNIQITPAIATVHWLIGLIDYGLVDIKTVNSFYDGLFYMLVKHQRLEPYLARLIYVLTKPEDVSRRQVSRILTLQSQYAKPRKHLVALLSLFKSYKPEHVPESIPSTNIESAWKSIPESLRQDLQDAARRRIADGASTYSQKNLVWNPVGIGAKSSKKDQLLVPMVRYINIGSSIMKDKDSKSIFEVRTLGELGKHQLSLELPCNALSLLANNAGHHILTFASVDYQSRFCYNLYNVLQNAFIHQVEKFSYAERDRLLTMTVQLCRYMQQEITLVSKFLEKYLPFWNGRDHQTSFFALVEWISFPSFPAAYNNVLVPLRTIWECSPVDKKCEILSTFGNMITNLFIRPRFKDSGSKTPALFLGATQTPELSEILEPLTKFITDIIVSGLCSEAFNGLLLSEALSFYEQVATLEERSDLLLWTLAPPAVIYGGYISRSISALSRVCSLLLKYRDINSKLREKRCRDLFERNIESLDNYAKDLAMGLWFGKAFSGSKDSYLLRFTSEAVLADLKSTCDIDTALNISNHSAILPYKFALLDVGMTIQTAEDCIKLAETYYPEIARFLRIFIE